MKGFFQRWSNCYIILIGVLLIASINSKAQTTYSISKMFILVYHPIYQKWDVTDSIPIEINNKAKINLIKDSVGNLKRLKILNVTDSMVIDDEIDINEKPMKEEDDLFHYTTYTNCIAIKENCKASVKFEYSKKEGFFFVDILYEKIGGYGFIYIITEL